MPIVMGYKVDFRGLPLPQSQAYAQYFSSKVSLLIASTLTGQAISKIKPRTFNFLMDNLPESWVFVELASERGIVKDIGLFCFYLFIFVSVNQNTPFLDCWRLEREIFIKWKMAQWVTSVCPRLDCLSLNPGNNIAEEQNWHESSDSHANRGTHASTRRHTLWI